MQSNLSQHRNIKNTAIALFALFSIFSTTAIADGLDAMAAPVALPIPQDLAMKRPFALPIPEDQTNFIEAFFTSGVAFSSLSNGNQSIDINDLTTNTYSTTKSTQSKTVDGAGISAIFPFADKINITLGPAFYYTDLGNVKGIEQPYSNFGNFQTLNYQFSAQSFSLLLESRAIYAANRIQPFVTAGIGASWNQLQNYSEVPTDSNSSASANPNVFRNNTQTNFAYEVGLGAQTQIYNDIKNNVSYNLALGYRYFNFGSGQLKQSIIQTGDQTLKINTLDTQTVLLTLSADFG